MDERGRGRPRHGPWFWPLWIVGGFLAFAVGGSLLLAFAVGSGVRGIQNLAIPPGSVPSLPGASASAGSTGPASPTHAADPVDPVESWNALACDHLPRLADDLGILETSLRAKAPESRLLGLTGTIDVVLRDTNAALTELDVPPSAPAQLRTTYEQMSSLMAVATARVNAATEAARTATADGSWTEAATSAHSAYAAVVAVEREQRAGMLAAGSPVSCGASPSTA